MTPTPEQIKLAEGACSFNAKDPNAPEFGKAYKFHNNSQLGYGTNIDVWRPVSNPTEPRVLVSKKSRSDFV